MDNKEITKPMAWALISLLAISILVASTGVSNLVFSLRQSERQSDKKSQTASIATSDGFIKKVNFPNVFLVAKSAIVYDAGTEEILFEKNAEVQLPLASITKVMMVIVALDGLPEDSVVDINSQALNEEGQSGLREGQKWKLKDIVDLTLVESSNDGAAAIVAAWSAFKNKDTSLPKDNNISSDFLEAMNSKAKEIGLGQTYFLNETGLDKNAIVSGGYGSALDVAKMFSYAISKFGSSFEATRYREIQVSSLGKTEYIVKNTNTSVEQIPGIVASKTGYTDLAGGNLVILFDAGLGHPIVISVLGSTIDGRFEDVSELIRATLDYLGSENLYNN